MTLEAVLNKLEETQKLANTNLEDIPPTTRGAWGAAIDEAKKKIGDLRAQLKDAILKNGVAIFLGGDSAKANEFAKLIHDEGEALVVDAKALYHRLASRVEAGIAPSRQWGVQETYLLHLGLQDVMQEVGLTEMPMPSRTVMPHVPTAEDVVNHIRTIVRNACGDLLNRMYIEEQAANDAIKIRYMNSVVPVAILNAEKDEVDGLGKVFAKGSATVIISSDDNIDREFMIKTFKDINKRIRKK